MTDPTDERLSARERDRARGKVAHAVRKGELIAQPCTWTGGDGGNGREDGPRCGNEPTSAHHDDYSKPLDVRWLCARHHRLTHDLVKVPLALRPGDVISWRRLRDSAGGLTEPVRVVKEVDGERVLCGVWIPAWLVDELG